MDKVYKNLETDPTMIIEWVNKGLLLSNLLTPEEKFILDQFTSERLGKEINNSLRNGNSTLYNKEITLLDSAIKKGSLISLPLYRGSHLPIQPIVGKVFTISNYWSASLNPSEGYGYLSKNNSAAYFLIITANKNYNTELAYLGGIPNYSNFPDAVFKHFPKNSLPPITWYWPEFEVIIPRNSRFKIINTEPAVFADDEGNYPMDTVFLELF